MYKRINYLLLGIVVILFGLGLYLLYLKFKKEATDEINNKIYAILQDKAYRNLAKLCYEDNYKTCSLNETLESDNLRGANCRELFNNFYSSYITDVSTGELLMSTFFSKQAYKISKSQSYLLASVKVINDEKCKK